MKEKILRFGNQLFYTLRFHSTGDLMTSDTSHALAMSGVSFGIGLLFMWLGTIFPPLLFNALIFFILSLMNIFGIFKLILGAPFRLVRKFLTHCEYSNIRTASIEQNWKTIHWIIYGVFGSITYIIWLFLLITLLFAYQPTEDNTGYIIPSATYAVGDVVAIDDSIITYGTIINTLDDNCYIINTPNGEETTTSSIKGAYKEYNNIFIALIQSFWGLVKKCIYNLNHFISFIIS